MQEKIRFVELKDSTGILNIYTPYVLDTTISFEYEPPSLSEFTERISNISSKYPYLVYERNSKILGFAYGSPYQERIAYLYISGSRSPKQRCWQKTLQLPFGPASKTGFL